MQRSGFDGSYLRGMTEPMTLNGSKIPYFVVVMVSREGVGEMVVILRRGRGWLRLYSVELGVKVLS